MTDEDRQRVKALFERVKSGGANRRAGRRKPLTKAHEDQLSLLKPLYKMLRDLADLDLEIHDREVILSDRKDIRLALTTHRSQPCIKMLLGPMMMCRGDVLILPGGECGIDVRVEHHPLNPKDVVHAETIFITVEGIADEPRYLIRVESTRAFLDATTPNVSVWQVVMKADDVGDVVKPEFPPPISYPRDREAEDIANDVAVGNAHLMTLRDHCMLGLNPSAPAATLNSPICGRVRIPQWAAAGRGLFTRSERALQLEPRPL